MSKFRSMIQKLLTLILVFLTGLIHSQARGPGDDPVRPMILVTPADRADILRKIESRDWAKTTYQVFIEQLDGQIESHAANAHVFLKGMPFDWEAGMPGMIPPFTYTIHINPNNGKRTNLDNATDEEYADAETLERYLQTVVDCGIA